jgi:hypothetical protein
MAGKRPQAAWAIMGMGLIAFSLLLAPASWAGEPSPASRAEIAHLFSYLESSGCDFYRNGSWYKSREASAHLHRKYQSLLEKGLVATAEDFIARAATESSMSGEPYRVRCGGGKAVESGPWFRAELLRHRGE